MWLVVCSGIFGDFLHTIGVSTITNPWKRKTIKLRVPTIPCGVFVGYWSKEGNLPWEFSINQGTEVESADEAGAQWVLRIGFVGLKSPTPLTGV